MPAPKASPPSMPALSTAASSTSGEPASPAPGGGAGSDETDAYTAAATVIGREGPTEPTTTTSHRLYGVVSSRPGALFTIDREAVDALPDSARDPATGFIRLCPSYLATNGAHCSVFAACPYAHARLSSSTRVMYPHVSSPAGSVVVTAAGEADGAIQPPQPSYPRYPEDPRPGAVVRVAFRDAAAGVSGMVVRPHECFRTRATLSAMADAAAAIGGHQHNNATAATPQPLVHCGHWVAHGLCHFGAECRFVHVVDLPRQPPAPKAARSPVTSD